MSISDERFYAQKDANFRQRVYNILYNDSKPHSEQEALELINNLSKGLPLKVIDSQELEGDISTYRDSDYAENVDRLVDNMKTN